MMTTTPNYTPLVVVGFVFVGLLWLATLVHCLNNRRLGDVEKLMWVIVIICLNVLGAALYALNRADTSAPPPSAP
jgi:uncharacterized membrane protein YhaH (DUF805 family)